MKEEIKNVIKNFEPVIFYSNVNYEREENLAFSVYPKTREEEINSCSLQRMSAQKYYAWKLLEYAVNRVIGIDFNKIDFKKSQNGKWECNSFYFSLSHSENAVVVALSLNPIGVDIEKIKPFKVELANKILTLEEKQEYFAVDKEEKQKYLLKTWCKKECLLKQSGEKALLPNQRQTLGVEFFE